MKKETLYWGNIDPMSHLKLRELIEVLQTASSKDYGTGKESKLFYNKDSELNNLFKQANNRCSRRESYFSEQMGYVFVEWFLKGDVYLRIYMENNNMYVQILNNNYLKYNFINGNYLYTENDYRIKIPQSDVIKIKLPFYLKIRMPFYINRIFNQYNILNESLDIIKSKDGNIKWRSYKNKENMLNSSNAKIMSEYGIVSRYDYDQVSSFSTDYSYFLKLKKELFFNKIRKSFVKSFNNGMKKYCKSKEIEYTRLNITLPFEDSFLEDLIKKMKKQKLKGSDIRNILKGVE